MSIKSSTKKDEKELEFSDNSEVFGTVNISGVKVLIRRVTYKGGKGTVYYNAYAKLKDSSVLKDEYLGHPTYRKNDWVGVDTMHSYNENQVGARKLFDALRQIECIIEQWQDAIKEDD